MKAVRILCKYLVIYLFIPLLILAGIEFFLRYKGWGENRHPWKEQVVGDKKIYTKNLAFYQQFFEHPGHPGEFEPHITMIQLPKPDNTIRIFVFGESAALGWPDSSYSMGRFLETMLNMLYPEHRWEVFNICFAGINSHIIRYLVERSLFLQPDLVIVYMGNNEAHGTFGLLHSFRNSVPLSPWIVQTHIYLQNLFLVQQLRNFATVLKNFFPRTSMRTIRWDDPRINIVTDNFEKNLKVIINKLNREHIPVFIGTMGANLRDWPPVESWFRKDITKKDLEEWNKYFGEGLSLISERKLTEAKNTFLKALQIDSSPAILNFFLAWSLLAEGEEQEAEQYFLEACKKDGFGFVRSKPFVNETIKKVTKEFLHNRNVKLVPVADELSKQAQRNIPGDDIFIDSCHFNFYGAYITACAYLREVIRYYSLTPHNPPSFEDVRIRLGITKGKEREFLAIIRREIPLTLIYFTEECQSFNYGELFNQLKKDFAYLNPQKLSYNYFYDKEITEMLFYSLTLSPENINSLLSCLEILNDLGSFRQGLAIAKQLCNRYPENTNFYFVLFDFAYNANDKETAELALKKIKEAYGFPEDTYLYLSLKWSIKQNEKEKAIELSNKLLAHHFALPSHKALAQCVLINEEQRLSFQQKLARWKEIIQKNPWSFDSFQYISKQTKSEQEKEMFKDVLVEIIQNNAKSALPYIFMAHIYEDENDIQQAIEMFQKATSVSPGSLFNYYELTRLLTNKAEHLLLVGNIEEANIILEQAIRTFPYYMPAWHNLIDTCILLEDNQGVLEKLLEWQEIQNKEIMKYFWEIIY